MALKGEEEGWGGRLASMIGSGQMSDAKRWGEEEPSGLRGGSGLACMIRTVVA